MAESLLGLVINGLLVLNERSFRGRPQKGQRRGCIVKCLTCERTFHTRSDNLRKGTVACTPCRDMGRQITDEINSDPEEVRRLTESIQQAHARQTISRQDAMSDLDTTEESG